tara:strand:+ start:63 stop:659 length:597 start_codon:yes stop_codon:yes gene_type:complete
VTKKTIFDRSNIGERVSAEIPPEKANDDVDRDVVTAIDEKRKLQKEGKFTGNKKRDDLSIARKKNRSLTLEQIHDLLEGKIKQTNETYYINHELIRKLVSINPYIDSVRHLAELSGFLNNWQTSNTSAQYQALLGNKNKSGYKSLTKEEMKKVAHALKFKEWRVLIHPEVDPNSHDKKEQSEDYLKEIAKIEAEFDEK